MTGDTFPQPPLFSHKVFSGIWWSPQPTWSETFTRKEYSTVGSASPADTHPFNKQKRTTIEMEQQALCLGVPVSLTVSLYLCLHSAGSKSFPVCPLRGLPGHNLPQCLFSLIIT